MSLKNRGRKTNEEYRIQREKYKTEYRKIGQNRDRVNAKYTPDEDREIILHEIPDRELAMKLGRQITAIQLRRSRLINGHVENGHIKGYIQEKVKIA